MSLLPIAGLPAPVKKRSNGQANRLSEEDRAAHDWYRFVLSYPPHLVSDYLNKFEIGPNQTVLDPFCGTGTTVVECKKKGINSVGIETLNRWEFVFLKVTRSGVNC